MDTNDRNEGRNDWVVNPDYPFVFVEISTFLRKKYTPLYEAERGSTAEARLKVFFLLFCKSEKEVIMLTILAVIGGLALLAISFVSGGIFATRKVRKCAKDVADELDHMIFK